MKKKYSISLLVIALLLSIAMTAGTSYAYWTKTYNQTNSNLVDAGCLKIELNDLDVNGSVTNINLNNAYPMSDSRGLMTTPYILKVSNVCNVKANYSITINSLITELTESQIKTNFVKVSPEFTTNNPVLVSSLTKTTLNNSLLDEIGDVTNSYVLGSGVLNAQSGTTIDSVTYNLQLWIDKNVVNDVSGKSYKAAIAVYAEAAL